MIYAPSAMVFHHHAPMGVRIHRAGAVEALMRNLPSVTETYLGLRYYTDHQRREARAVRVLSILSGSGSIPHRLVRPVVQTAMLPDTLRRIRQTKSSARSLMNNRSEIPTLDQPGSENAG